MLYQLSYGIGRRKVRKCKANTDYWLLVTGYWLPVLPLIRGEDVADNDRAEEVFSHVCDSVGVKFEFCVELILRSVIHVDVWYAMHEHVNRVVVMLCNMFSNSTAKATLDLTIFDCDDTTYTLCNIVDHRCVKGLHKTRIHDFC